MYRHRKNKNKKKKQTLTKHADFFSSTKNKAQRKNIGCGQTNCVCTRDYKNKPTGLTARHQN